jgi:phosphoglycolate phosphatase-like HAD superfamily hydrolase
MARIFDFGGTLNQYNQSITPAQADYLAIRGDWQLIGMDLAHILDTERQRMVGTQAD